MDTMQIVSACIAVALSLGCAWCDYRKGLIPNVLVIPGLLVGIILSSVAQGWTGGISALVSALAIAVVPLLLFRFNAMGGGDVKLLASLGALLGFELAIQTMMLAFLAGALWGVGIWVKQGTLVSKLALSAAKFVPGHSRRLKTQQPTYIRLGPAIFIATAIVVISQWGKSGLWILG